jgi:mRNA interferase RelE/StbE
MKWEVDISKNSLHFINNNHLDEKKIIELVILAIKKVHGLEANIDIKKLKGEWKGFYRISHGKIRIIIQFQFSTSHVLVERVDFRGNIYK